jgi:hypothetical protein
MFGKFDQRFYPRLQGAAMNGQTKEQRESFVGGRRSALGAILCVLVLIPTFEPALAQQRPCECYFKDPAYKAIGTKAACTAWMGKGKTSCEIEFAGVGADTNLISTLIGRQPAAYRREVYDVLSVYAQYLRDGKRDDLLSSQFLQRALPIFMRGAYLRNSQGRQLGEIKEMDSRIAAFVEKFAPLISDVFQGKNPGFSTEIPPTKFTVGRGYILVDDPAGDLIQLYMSAE